MIEGMRWDEMWCETTSYKTHDVIWDENDVRWSKIMWYIIIIIYICYIMGWYKITQNGWVQ